MLRYITAFTLLAVLAGVAPAQDPAPDQLPPKAEDVKVDRGQMSYALGLNIGQSVQRDQVELDFDKIVEGLLDGLKGSPPALDPEKIRAGMIAYQEQIQAKAQAAVKEIADKNQKEADTFLAENKKKKGIETTESGLQYEVLKEGEGASPKETDSVKAHYHGTFINGEVFDSSVERGEPLVIPLNRVIPGWTEALTMMKVGEKWRVFLPPNLAYGENPSPNSPISPNQMLIFEIELLGIEE